MILKYKGKEPYLDVANRFELNKGDLLEIADDEGIELVKLKEFEEVKEG